MATRAGRTGLFCYQGIRNGYLLDPQSGHLMRFPPEDGSMAVQQSGARQAVVKTPEVASYATPDSRDAGSAAHDTLAARRASTYQAHQIGRLHSESGLSPGRLTPL